jgi:hypothetical protein
MFRRDWVSRRDHTASDAESLQYERGVRGRSRGCRDYTWRCRPYSEDASGAAQQMSGGDDWDPGTEACPIVRLPHCG